MSPARPARAVAAGARRRARRVWDTALGREVEPFLPGGAPAPSAAASRPEPTAATSRVEAVSAFLFLEARLLDERRWEDWLGMWEPGASYSMPTRRNVQPGGADRPIDEELAAEGTTWWFDETVEIAAVRVAKLRTGKAWAEEPPSRTRRFVTNVEVDAAVEGAVAVRSNLLLHRGRRDSDVEWFSCAREDVLGDGASGLRLRSRRVVIDANVLPADNLMLFL